LLARAIGAARAVAARATTFGAAVAASVIAFGCGSSPDPEPQIVEDVAQIRYVGSDTLLPHIQFADGQESLNDRCPVRRVKLNLRMPPVYVNGRPIGFC
jgi:hypothetical protein